MIALFNCYLNIFVSDLAIIQNSLIGSNGSNRCLCKVFCWRGTKPVTTQWGHNVTVLPGVTVVDFHSDVVISDY